MESRHWINNEFIASEAKESYEIRSPFDDHVVGKIPFADEKVVDKAVAAARAAFDGEWSTWTPDKRAKAMLKFADLVEAKADEIAAIEAASIGQPAIAAKMMTGVCASVYRYYAGWTDKIAGESYKEEGGAYRIVQYEPFGVCGGIAAWNATIMYVAWKIAPALAAGNTFVFKSSEKVAPFTPLLVAPLFKEAGFPAGVVNFISGGGLTGNLLSAHMDIDKISFTGSGFTGRKVQDAATKSNMKKVTLELGGKSPAIIFEDANIPNAIGQNSQGFLMNTGQVCAATSRVFVQKSIAPKVIELLKGAFQQAEGAFADPKEATTMLGPVADKAQYDRVMSFIESGKSESGAQLVTGGGKIEGQKGFFIQPTIFTDAKDDAKIYREEIFGPVLNIRTFETEEDAIKLANDTSFGLSSAIYTESISRAMRVASKIRAGTVGINGVAFPHHTTPFGGYKQSGYGRELGKAGLFAYLQEKTISINMAI